MEESLPSVVKEEGYRCWMFPFTWRGYFSREALWKRRNVKLNVKDQHRQGEFKSNLFFVKTGHLGLGMPKSVDHIILPNTVYK